MAGAIRADAGTFPTRTVWTSVCPFPGIKPSECPGPLVKKQVQVTDWGAVPAADLPPNVATQLAAQDPELAAELEAAQTYSAAGFAVGGAVLGGVGAVMIGRSGWVGAGLGALAGYAYSRLTEDGP